MLGQGSRQWAIVRDDASASSSCTMPPLRGPAPTTGSQLVVPLGVKPCPSLELCMHAEGAVQPARAVQTMAGCTEDWAMPELAACSLADDGGESSADVDTGFYSSMDLLSSKSDLNASNCEMLNPLPWDFQLDDVLSWPQGAPLFLP
jgi:hypothetical protein